MLNDTSVASAGSYIRTCRRIRNSKKIATIRDFHQNICVNPTIGEMCFVEESYNIYKIQLVYFLERSLFQIWEFAFKIVMLLLNTKKCLAFSFLDKETAVRLVNAFGTSPNEGRVELLYDGKYGTICDDTFDMNAAAVICKQLGYTGATRYCFNTLQTSMICFLFTYNCDMLVDKRMICFLANTSTVLMKLIVVLQTKSHTFLFKTLWFLYVLRLWYTFFNRSLNSISIVCQNYPIHQQSTNHSVCIIRFVLTKRLPSWSYGKCLTFKVYFTSKMETCVIMRLGMHASFLVASSFTCTRNLPRTAQVFHTLVVKRTFYLQKKKVEAP